MNNGDNFSDPDYDDFEFREQHPYVYGDDDDDYPQPNSRQTSSRPTTESDELFHAEYMAWKIGNKERIERLNAKVRKEKESDELFHAEYMAWKAANKERIEQLKQHSAPKPRPQGDEDLGNLIVVIGILVFVVLFCVCIATCE